MINQVLYVDDDKTALSLFNLVNNKAAFANQALIANSAQQVLDFYDQLLHMIGTTSIYPEILFIDLVMPIMDGLELLDVFTRKYLSAFPDTKVIVLTSSINPADKLKVEDYTCVTDFVTKPVTVQLLNELRVKLKGG
ncbi:response regulator [Telluribacter humicola]|uniref:response regulator n=1 Tax=Telluribacter humicola TaxID=1720261 RepID=UPI001A956BAA|nr:response regulator [Telluribacter humicola]